MRKRLLCLRWPVLYVTTIAAIVWWYEYGSVWQASNNMQGVWCELAGEPHAEQLTDNHFFVKGDTTWFSYPDNNGKWNANRSRISLRRAEGFYLVTRTYGFNQRNTRTTEYIVMSRGDQLYLLNGLARLDPQRKIIGRKLRRIERLPAAAAKAIDAAANKGSSIP